LDLKENYGLCPISTIIFNNKRKISFILKIRKFSRYFFLKTTNVQVLVSAIEREKIVLLITNGHPLKRTAKKFLQKKGKM
jgi:hypothetical protein